MTTANVNVLNQIIKQNAFGAPSTGTSMLPQGNNQTSIIANIDKYLDKETGQFKYVIAFRYNSIVIDDKIFDSNTFIRSLDDTADVYIKAYIKEVKKAYKQATKKNLELESNRVEDGNLQILNKIDGIRAYYYYVKKYIFNIK